jgi:hypothetical protein
VGLLASVRWANLDLIVISCVLWVKCGLVGNVFPIVQLEAPMPSVSAPVMLHIQYLIQEFAWKSVRGLDACLNTEHANAPTATIGKVGFAFLSVPRVPRISMEPACVKTLTMYMMVFPAPLNVWVGKSRWRVVVNARLARPILEASVLLQWCRL